MRLSLVFTALIAFVLAGLFPPSVCMHCFIHKTTTQVAALLTNDNPVENNACCSHQAFKKNETPNSLGCHGRPNQPPCNACVHSCDKASTIIKEPKVQLDLQPDSIFVSALRIAQLKTARQFPIQQRTLPPPHLARHKKLCIFLL